MFRDICDTGRVSNETRFRRTVTAVGFSLIAQFFMFNTLYGLPTLLFRDLIPGFDGPISEIVVALCESAVYILCMTVPLVVFRIAMGKTERARPYLGVAADPGVFLLIPAAVGINTAVSYFNFEIISFLPFGYAEQEHLSSIPVLMVLELISTAIIPAVFEELFFRGCLLSNLLPFGRTGAIFLSAFCFSMMHGSPHKFLHTFCTGLILGAVYVYYRSIWPGTLIHFCNNLLSAMSLGGIGGASGVFGGVPSLLTDIVIMAGGLACSVLFAVYVARRGFHRVPYDNYTEPEYLPVNDYGRNMIRPTLVVFVALTVASSLLNVFYLLIAGLQT